MAVAFTRSNYPDTEEATLFYGNERDADAISIREEGKPIDERTRSLFPWETRSLVRRRVLQIVICLLGLVIMTVIICAFTLKNNQPEYTYLGKARFKLEDKMIEFKNAADKFVLHGDIGIRVQSTLTERHTKASSTFKYVTQDGITLVLKQESEFSLIINWTSSVKNTTVFQDCLSLEGSHWYGGSDLLSQKWPLEKVSVNMAQYVPHDPRYTRNMSVSANFGSVLERYWLSSSGVAILVDSSVPLHVSINANGDKRLCLKSDTSGYLEPAVSKLIYRILCGTDPKSLHLKVIYDFLGWPKDVPAVEIIKHPIWVTSSENISQKQIETFIKNINLLDYHCSHVIIEGDYSTENENFKFDHVKFPKPKEMISKITSYGCNVSLAVRPHLKIGSKEFYQANEQGYLLRDCGGEVPGIIKGHNYFAACIDITSEKNKLLFKKKLEAFQKEIGFTAFEFHNGDVSHLPFCYKLQNKSMDPGNFAKEYARFAADIRGVNINMGYKSQNLPIFVKMANKDAMWDGATGLKSLIPSVLTFGIMGYPYVLPSVIGGHHGNYDKELYIRWLQASLFLPGIQFLKPPWDYDERTAQIVRDLLKLRSSLLPIILEAFNNVTNTGAPIIRPMWWIAPFDKEALKIDSQFMLGDKYLVAPVLEKAGNGQVFNKEVYLPPGQWQEMFNNKQNITNVKIGRWKRYDVTLTDLLYFKCLTLYN